MIILCVIIFQLMERIVIIISQIFGGYALDMLGFSYSAIPTRHEVHIKPHLTENNNKPIKN